MGRPNSRRVRPHSKRTSVLRTSEHGDSGADPETLQAHCPDRHDEGKFPGLSLTFQEAPVCCSLGESPGAWVSERSSSRRFNACLSEALRSYAACFILNNAPFGLSVGPRAAMCDVHVRLTSRCAGWMACNACGRNMIGLIINANTT